MSLPPEIITVRRKRRAGADDGPVNFLRVEETKRQRSGTWLYRRKQPDIQTPGQTSSETASPGKPIIHSSRQGDEKIPLGALSHATSRPPNAEAQQQAAAPPFANAPSPRRFHLSRSHVADRTPGRSGSKRSRFASALFVERSGKRKKTAEDGGDRIPGGGSVQEEQTTPGDIEMGDAAPPAQQRRRIQKRPGVKSSSRVAATTTTRPPPQLPPSLARRQYDTSTAALSREMDSWALEHIAHTLVSQERERMRSQHASTPAKYRPKAPAKRFAERHPEAVSPGKAGGEGGDMEVVGDDDTGSETADEDYVMETYVRVPAHTLEAPVPPEQLGVLVFDLGSDVEYFYGLEDDSEDEYLEDEEDSNDENHYTADYPEDEVESDDEYGRDDYRFRTGNASDKEEFDDADEDEAVRSDDEAGLPGTRLWREQREIRSRLGLPRLKG